jgi:hypothetical protein
MHDGQTDGRTDGRMDERHTFCAHRVEHGGSHWSKGGYLLPPNTTTVIMECYGNGFQCLDTSGPCHELAMVLNLEWQFAQFAIRTFSSGTGGLHIRAPKKKACVAQNTSLVGSVLGGDGRLGNCVVDGARNFIYILRYLSSGVVVT